MRWDARKNEALKATRGVTFEAVVVAIGAGGLLDVVAHPNAGRYAGQRVLVVEIDDYGSSQVRHRPPRRAAAQRAPRELTRPARALVGRLLAKVGTVNVEP